MENETRHDLNAAIENWRQELAAQPGLTAEDRRELQTHLRDAIAGFQQRGLSDDESFWLARRRVGRPQLLGEEFIKADPALVWRERVFWMAFGLLILRLWNILSTSVISPLFSRADLHWGQRLADLFPDWVSFYFPGWLRDLHYAPYLRILYEFSNALLVLAIWFSWLEGNWRKRIRFGNLLPKLDFSLFQSR